MIKMMMTLMEDYWNPYSLGIKANRNAKVGRRILDLIKSKN